MGWNEVISEWEPVGEVAPGPLREARLEAHWAAQVVASFGITRVAPAPDDSHTSMIWLAGKRLLAGEEDDDGLRVFLDLERLALGILGEDDEPAGAFPLGGKSLEDAHRWLADALRSRAGETLEPLRRPVYEVPSHPVGSGARFGGASAEALEELARWYSNGARLARAVASGDPGASPVRCWPHHFDIATLITFDPDQPDPEVARSIGVGLSPGNGSYDEPYFYVSPWPRPELAGTPALDGEALWHTEGWFGAVLPASRLGRGGDARDQGEQAAAFALSALGTSRLLINV